MKNTIVLIGVVTVAAAGVYLFLQRDATRLAFDGGSLSEDTLARTQAFIEHRRVLEQVKLDVSIFTDPRFVALQGFSDPVPQLPKGRTNPFALPESVGGFTESAPQPSTEVTQ